MENNTLLARIDERTIAIKETLDMHISAETIKHTEHEIRIRELEAWKNRIIGVAMGAGALAGALAAVALNVVSRFLFRG